MRLNQITIYVSDIKRSIAFYKKLGLKQIVDDKHYARFLCPDGNSTFSLHVSHKPIKPSGAVIYFECDDLDKTVNKLKKAGIQFNSEPCEQEWLWREAYLTDPDGHRLCLYYAGENRINPPWRIN